MPVSLLRNVPLRKRRPTPRRWKCVVCRDYVLAKSCPTCKSRKGTMRKALTARADALWTRAVKGSGVCAAASRVIPCSGALEAAHVVPRRHRSVRWLIANGRTLCRSHHAWFGANEKAWRDFIGPDWDRLWGLAQQRWNREYPIPALLAALRAT